MTPIDSPRRVGSPLNFIKPKKPKLPAIAALLAAFSCAHQAGAETLKPLWSFGSSKDGQLPVGALAGVPGRLFGVTLGGGQFGYGTVYVLEAGQEQVLHNFTNKADGGIPSPTLVKVGETLYGTNQIGGTTGNGVVFAIDAKTGAEKTVYSFAGRTDGGSPLAGVSYKNGELYGTAFLGGTRGAGTAFKIDIATGAETTLHNFGASGDGNSPASNLIFVRGLLYGTTEIGGKFNAGTVYSLNPITGAEKILHSLDGAADGSAPQAGLVVKNGDLYGTASTGGTAGAGTIFKVNSTTGAAVTVYSFLGKNDGKEPLTALTVFGNTLYGTANFGGLKGDGTLFSLPIAGAKLKVLHSFTGQSDGKYPQGALYYVNGTLYGTANAGGTTGFGTAFSLAVQ